MTRVVSSARCRETGTVTEVWDRGTDDAEVRDGWNRWETVCVDHGTVCSHTTRELAFRFRPIPSEWCEDCMAQVGYRDGHDDQYVAPEE